MTLKQRGDHEYGDNQADIREYLLDYSETKGYAAEQFADAVCRCDGRVFRLALDDIQGAAVRSCVSCGTDTAIGDSADYLESANLEDCACPCGSEVYEVTIGVSLYRDSDDVRWLYVGARCAQCGLTACYGDWKNEFIGYEELLARV